MVSLSYIETNEKLRIFFVFDGCDACSAMNFIEILMKRLNRLSIYAKDEMLMWRLRYFFR